MKHLLLFAAALIPVSCSLQESSESKAIREYIVLNVDNPKSYEPVETLLAKITDLYEHPVISNQLMNVENVEGRICDLLERMGPTFHNVLTDTMRVIISELLHVYEESVLEKFGVAHTFLKGTALLLPELEKIEAKVPALDRQEYLMSWAQYEGAMNRLEKEVNLLFHIINQELGLSGYDDLTAAINSRQVFVQKYRIEENGVPVLKGALFLIRKDQVITSMPVEVNKM